MQMRLQNIFFSDYTGDLNARIKGDPSYNTFSAILGDFEVGLMEYDPNDICGAYNIQKEKNREHLSKKIEFDFQPTSNTPFSINGFLDVDYFDFPR